MEEIRRALRVAKAGNDVEEEKEDPEEAEAREFNEIRALFKENVGFVVFVMLASVLVVTECILVGYPHKGVAFKLQIAVLAASSFTPL